MQKYFFLLLLITSATFLKAQTKETEKPWSTRSLSTDAIKQVEVTTSGGSITVSGVNANESRIEVYIQPNNRRNNEVFTKEEIEDRLKAYELSIAVSGNKVVASATPKENNLDWKKALSISFKVYVPQQVSTVLKTSGGSIHLDNLTGTQEFRTSGGSLHLNQLSGITKGHTSGGSIHVSNSRDVIELSTSGGSVHAEKCMGTITLTTSGGSLQLMELQGNIKAVTSGGSITGRTIDGELSTRTSGGSISLTGLSCSLEASTSAGRMEISMHKLGKYLRLDNSGGSINLQIPAASSVDLRLSGNRVNSGTLKNFDGVIQQDEISGKLNGGGTPITARSSSGSVTLSMK
jgi:hypothetical protein